MEYLTNGVIKFHPATKLKLDAECVFWSPSGVRTKLNSDDDNNVVVELTLESPNKTIAEELAEIELKRIADIISYFQNIPVKETKITGMTSSTADSRGKHIIIEEKIISKDEVSIVHQLDLESTENLVKRLKETYSSDIEDVLSMWREAISTETSALKYLLIYRLMEFIFKSDTKNLTKWIRSKDPNVKIVTD